MDTFSQLVKDKVRLTDFRYTPIAPSTPNSCNLCRIYNNIYSMILDTHMSPLDDGRLVITGHVIKDKKKFDEFLHCDHYSRVDVSRYGAPEELFNSLGLNGYYGVLNGDDVYFLEVIK